MSDTLISKYNSANINPTEGSCSKLQIEYFTEFLQKHRNIHTILEIGFNGGLSALAFLSARPDITLISVDIGEHEYVLKAKRFIDSEFPNRHILIIGDSTTAIPNLRKSFPDYRPDFIFMDGGHDAPVPRLDLDNCLDIARPDTWICIDDVVEWMKDIISSINNVISQHKMVVLDQKRHDIHGWVLCKKIC
jgi:predicted O-methyltransferase YrrM